MSFFRNLLRGQKPTDQPQDPPRPAPTASPQETAPGGFVIVGKASDFAAGEGKMVVVGRRHVAVFRLDDGLHAIDNLCLHQAGPLCEGEIDGGVVTCPWHGWQFSVTTGRHCLAATISQRRYEVTVEGEDVFVELPE